MAQRLKKTPKRPDDQTTVAITVEVHRRLTSFARENGMHVGPLATLIIRDALKQIEREGLPAAIAS